jgi:hypothetical protein
MTMDPVLLLSISGALLAAVGAAFNAFKLYLKRSAERSVVRELVLRHSQAQIQALTNASNIEARHRDHDVDMLIKEATAQLAEALARLNARGATSSSST